MNAFTDVTIDIDDLVNPFTGVGSKPSTTDEGGIISDVADIICGASKIMAAVVAPKFVVPAEVLAGAFGAAGGIVGVIDAATQTKDVPPLDRNILGLKNYMRDQGNVFVTLIENTGAAFLANPVNASELLNNTSSYNWLNRQNEPTWDTPQIGIDATISMLKA